MTHPRAPRRVCWLVLTAAVLFGGTVPSPAGDKEKGQQKESAEYALSATVAVALAAPEASGANETVATAPATSKEQPAPRVATPAPANASKTAGGNVEVIDLPDIGIKGNTHMMMMDKNSDQVADVMQKWLVAKGFAE